MAVGYNYLMLMGQVVEMIHTKPGRDEVGRSLIKLSVERAFRSVDGTVHVDIIPVVVYGAISKLASENIKTGDTITIKGRIENRDTNQFSIVGERILLLNERGDIK